MERVLIHVADDRRLAVDPETISHVQVHGECARVFRPGAEPLDDLRKLGALAASWKPHGFVRVHEDCLVNPGWVAELVRAPGPERRWTLVLRDAGASRLEVERERMAELWAALGER